MYSFSRFDLTVGGSTHLDGAVISSTADKDKNHFSTFSGTLDKKAITDIDIKVKRQLGIPVKLSKSKLK